MINLLPPEGHKAVKQEYLFRVGSSLLLLFSCIAVFLTVAFVPTYVLVGAQIRASEAEVQKKSVDEAVFKTAEAEVTETKEILDLLKKTSETRNMSAVIAEIQKSALPTISFKTFHIQASEGAITSVQVQGVAETREALSRFKNVLEKSELFERAEVPISDLARETKLPFVVTITPRVKTP